MQAAGSSGAGSADVDIERLHAAVAGDLAAYASIVEGLLPAAFRVASAILGREAEAAEATEDAVAAAWRELPRLDAVERFDAWFRQIVVSECRMRLRRLKEREVSRAVMGALERIEAASDTTTLSQPALIDILDDAFERLDGDDRTILVLRDLENLAPAEIAAMLHLPVGTVKWRLHEARGVLLDALGAVR